MPVATQGSVKTLSPEEVVNLGSSIVLSNTYHLYLQPGIKLIEEMGGLHEFMRWHGPILTDSGGFQVFSMGSLMSVNNHGATFQSHVDGSRHLLTPEDTIDYQQRLGTDIMMCFDQCVGSNEDLALVRTAMNRTHIWAERCKNRHSSTTQTLFGIIQGGVSSKLREESLRYITDLNFSGYAIGGLAVGETKSEMYSMVQTMGRSLPKDKPRYLMGVGSPEDLVRCVSRGIDMFDCVLPSRVARNGAFFTKSGRMNIKSTKYRRESGPIDKNCDCYACTNFSSAYLHHLFKARELLGPRLTTIHNLRYIQLLMQEMRSVIQKGTFDTFATDFLNHYAATDEQARLKQKSGWLIAKCDA